MKKLLIFIIALILLSIPVLALPTEFDYRDHNGQNWMTPVKNQGSCGSCGVFATLGSVEALYNIERNDPNFDLDLSEQHLVSNYSDQSCSGAGNAGYTIKDKGIVDEQCFTYKASDSNMDDICGGPNGEEWEKRLWKIKSWSAWSVGSNEDIKDRLIDYGPLYISIAMDGSFSNGVYSNCGSTANHAVVLVGYNDSGNYWIAKNSWGNSWNGDGYFKLDYDTCGPKSFYFAHTIEQNSNYSTEANESSISELNEQDENKYSLNEEAEFTYDLSKQEGADKIALVIEQYKVNNVSMNISYCNENYNFTIQNSEKLARFNLCNDYDSCSEISNCTLSVDYKAEESATLDVDYLVVEALHDSDNDSYYDEYDCKPNDKNVNPSMSEKGGDFNARCFDGIDNDCDGDIDEDDSECGCVNLTYGEYFRPSSSVYLCENQYFEFNTLIELKNDNVHIDCRNSTIAMTGSTKETIFTFGDKSGIKIRNCNFIGQGEKYVVKASYNNDFEMYNVSIKNFTEAFRLYGTSYDSNQGGLYLHDFTMSDVTYGIRTISTDWVYYYTGDQPNWNIKLENGNITNADYGLYLEQNTWNLTIKDVNFENNTKNIYAESNTEINGAENWWGNKEETNIQSLLDVSGTIDYSNWLCGPVGTNTSCCDVNLINTTWTNWTNETCLINDSVQQNRSRIEYDQNNCGTFENVTYYDLQNIECDYCTPDINYSEWSEWTNEDCSNEQMNQSQYRIEYDTNYCAEVDNQTLYNYQLIGPQYINTTWTQWYNITECLPNDYYTQERNLSETDNLECAQENKYFQLQNLTCDYCTPNLINQTEEWVNISCLPNNTMNQSKNILQYDNNYCGEVSNQTFIEYKNTDFCDYCTPELDLTEWSTWQDETCVENQINQSKFQIEYDINYCREIDNQTLYNYQLIGPQYTNSSWTQWYNITECLQEDYYTQERNLSETDELGCAQTNQHFQLQNQTCDYCTPELDLTKWSTWQDETCVENKMNQSKYQIEFDANYCAEVDNQTLYNYQLIGPQYTNSSWTQWYNITECLPEDHYTQESNLTETDNIGCAQTNQYFKWQNQTCDYCTPELDYTSWSQWTNEECSNQQMNQSQYRIEFDTNYCGEVNNQTLYNYQLIGPQYTNTSWTQWYNITECQPDNYYTQESNLIETDGLGCAQTKLHFKWQNQTCDYCTPNLINESEQWINVTCLPNNTMNQSRNILQYDDNYCGEVNNQSFTEYRNTEFCDYCTPELDYTSWSQWTNEECSNQQMSQSQYRIEFDTNYCGEVDNQTSYNHQLIGPQYTNSSWTQWYDITECLPDNYYTQERNLTETDELECAQTNHHFQLQNQTCDYCTPSLVNETKSNWIDVSCLSDNTMSQSRLLNQYDTNYCGEVDNQTFTEYKNTEYCDYCTPELDLTEWSTWQDETCVENKMNQSQSQVQYDINYCGEVNNQTEYNYQLIGPQYTNSSWTQWYDITECLPDDYYTQEKNLTEFDNLGCAQENYYFQLQNQTCDYCTPSLFNETKSNWINISCLSDNTMSQSRLLNQYDTNNCGEVDNQTVTEYKNTEYCDYCTPELDLTEWSTWQDETCVENKMNQSQSQVQYDINYCGEVNNQTEYNYQLIGPQYTNSSWTQWYDITECLPDDYYTQERNFTESDNLGCAQENHYFQIQNQTCDYCTPELVNESEQWINISCLTDDKMNQSRAVHQYDDNSCGEVEDEFFTEFRDAEFCDYCTPEMENTEWSDWSNESCLFNDKMNQSRQRTIYDINYCGEVNNQTQKEYQAIEECDYCTPEMDYTSWSNWEDVGQCLIDNSILQQSIRTYYDINYCEEIDNQTLKREQDGFCDYCVSEWINVNESCNNQIKEINYIYTNSCYEDTGLESDNTIPDDYTIPCCSVNSECNDGLYCNGQETCNLETESCKDATEAINCSNNDLNEFETCDYNPDGISFTLDYFLGFTSECNEVTDSCTQGNIEITSTCDESCNAECVEDSDCTDYNGATVDVCEDGCTCSYYDVIHIKDGWNALSFPSNEEIDIRDLKKQCPEISRTIWYFDQSGYSREEREFDPEKAYWIYAMEDCDFLMNFDYIFNDVDLSPGWNFVGSSSEIKSIWTLWGKDTPGIGWAYNDTGYDKIKHLYPGKGTWVYAFEEEADEETRSREVIPPAR